MASFEIAVATQVFQDWQSNQIDWAHFFGYFVMVLLGVAAREKVVPLVTHDLFVDNRNEDLAKAYNRGKIDGAGE